MATNKHPFVRSRSKDGLPSVFKGLVQAGSTQAIKVGEICNWDDTTGYWVPIDAVADHRYVLAISKEEQKASGRAELTAERYIDFYALAPEDEFEFVLAAAESLLLGNPYTLTASDSQKLTAAAGAFAVAINVDDGHYPQEEDTTVRNRSYAIVSFNPAVTWWGYRLNQSMRAGRKVLAIAGSEELKESDMYNTLALVATTATVTLPAVKPAMDIIIVSVTAAVVTISPNASDKIRVKGALLADDKDIDNDTAGGSTATAGDTVQLITEGADGFCAINVEGSNWATT